MKIFNFQIKNHFSYEDQILNDLKSFEVYKFTCANCSSSYKDSYKDNKSHILKYLYSTETCFDSCHSLCFKIIDKANSKFDLKIEEALHINWRKPHLNAQQNHLALTI